jgi:uncharacterized membrane protein YraQ (UPF0718 family)
LANVLYQSWLVLGDLAPYLLLGFAAAGLISVCISPEWIERHLGGPGLRPVIKAALWGIPLPLCSCGVVPVAASMRRHGASRAATTAFLLSTPQTGVDSIAATYALLGPVFAAFRPVAALVSGLLGGTLILLAGPGADNGGGEPKPAPCTESCCHGDRRQSPLLRAARYGFVTLPRDLALALLAGVLIGGAMAAWLPPHLLDSYVGGGLTAVVLGAAAGIPVYVCATASVPIAAGLIHLGASPGAALAFLVAGAASNPATFTTLWKVLGRRTALLYLLTAVASAVICGLLLDAIFLLPAAGRWLPQFSAHPHVMAESGLGPNLWAVALLLVLVNSCVMSRRSGH